MGRCRSIGAPVSTAGRVSARTLLKALLWAITTALATSIVCIALGVSLPTIGALIGRGPARAWAVWGFWTTLQALVWVVAMQLVFVFLMGIIWIALVGRQPDLDRTRRGFLLGCLMVSLPATLSAWTPKAFGWLPSPTTKPDISTMVTALISIGLCWLGVLLPRLIVPGLKQGQLIPPLGDTDPEPVK